MATNNSNANNVFEKAHSFFCTDSEVMLLSWDEKLRNCGFDPCRNCSLNGHCSNDGCRFHKAFQEKMSPVDSIENIQFIAGRAVISQCVCGYYGKAPEYLDKILRRLY